MNAVLLVESLVTLLVMVNPLSVIPAYLSLTRSLSPEARRHILTQAAVFALSILVITTLIGKLVLTGLGISIFALQIAGGILFFKFGYEVMTGTLRAETDQAPGLVPLGFPIIAGPGSITAIVLLSSRHQEITPYLLTAIIVVVSVTFVLLYHARSIIRILGDDATTAIVKLMGLLVLTIGIQLILAGIQLWMISVHLLV